MSTSTQNPPVLAQRKSIEIRHKLGSLIAEFQDWQKLSEKGQRFQKNHSQIRRLAAWLGGYLETLDHEIAALQAAPETALERCREIEVDILMAHRLWDYFRRKLIVRGLDRFERFLFAADEFAWACYEPAQLKSTGIPPERVKDPPLVYFHGVSSPLASSREVALRAEELEEGDESPEELLKILPTLPIPIVGVPWFQVEHLPDALLLGHEVGHNVCDDFGLAGSIDKLIAGSGVGPSRLPGWKAWKHEIFADFHGTLAGGPAFVGALIDFLARDPKIVSTDYRDATWWGAYPPDYLRVLLNLEYLRQLQPTFPVASLAAEWTASFRTHVMGEFVADLEPIARAFCNGKFLQLGNCTLPQILCFSEEQQKKAVQCAEEVLNGFGVKNEEVRVLFAAARIAFARDAEKYQRLDIATHLIEKVARTTTVRAENLRGDPAQLQAFIDSDTKAGGAELARIRRARNSRQLPLIVGPGATQMSAM